MLVGNQEIRAGQRWLTRSKGIVTVLTLRGQFPRKPVVLESETGEICRVNLSEDNDEWALVRPAPKTVKRTMALFRADSGVFEAHEMSSPRILEPRSRVSEPVEVEFALLPGEEP